MALGQVYSTALNTPTTTLSKDGSSVVDVVKEDVFFVQTQEQSSTSSTGKLSKVVQLPTVPLPKFSNVSAAFAESSSSYGHKVMSSASTPKGEIEAQVSISTAITIDTKPKMSYSEKPSEIATTSSTIQDVPVCLAGGSTGIPNLSAPTIPNTNSPTLPSIPISETDEQIRLENSGSSMSLSNVINFSASNTPSSPASYKTTASSLRPTSHPSATFSISSRSPSPAYSNPNSVTSSQDVILSEPGCGSGRPSVDSPAISATYSDMANDVSDGISQTSSVDQELKEEIIQSTRTDSNLNNSASPSQSSASPPTDGCSTRDLGLKVPVSEIDPSILPKTFVKGKLTATITTAGRAGQSTSISTTLINKMRPPKGTVNLERSQEICQKAIAKSPNWVQVDANVVGATLQQIGRKQTQTNTNKPVAPNQNPCSSSVPSIIMNSNTPSSILTMRPAGSTTGPNLGQAVPISIRPSSTNASGSVQIMALPATVASTMPLGGIRGASISSTPGNGNLTNAVLVNAVNNSKVNASFPTKMFLMSTFKEY